MSTNPVHDFIKTNWTVIYRFALGAATSRFRFFGLTRYQSVSAGQISDIVQNVLLKLCTPPYAWSQDELTRERFLKKVGNMINTEVWKHIKKWHNRATDSTDFLEPSTDDQFVDWLLAEAQADQSKIEFDEYLQTFLSKVDHQLTIYEEKDVIAWAVLTEWRQGKKPQQIASENGLDIKDVQKAQNRIRTALKKSV